MAIGHSWPSETYTERCRCTCMHATASHLLSNSRLCDVMEWCHRTSNYLGARAVGGADLLRPLTPARHGGQVWGGWLRVVPAPRPSGKGGGAVPGAGLHVARQTRAAPGRRDRPGRRKDIRPRFSDQSSVLQHLHPCASYPLQALLSPSPGRDSTEHP